MRDINTYPVPAGYRWIGGKVADNFAGGGGASTGIAQALCQSPDIAVNHNAEALMMHEQNHPYTITSKARFGLVTIKGQDYQIVDIGMRMLEPHELYRCQGFPADYQHETVMGKKLPKHAQVRMVGNSVPPGLARALVSANIPRWALRCEMAESA